jgi:hypothetical protein
VIDVKLPEDVSSWQITFPLASTVSLPEFKKPLHFVVARWSPPPVILMPPAKVEEAVARSARNVSA